MNKKGITRKRIDPAHLPPLSAKQKRALEELAAMPDSAIDYSDIPAMRPEDAELYKPVKRSTTIRIDADILAWLRTYGKGYQTKINAILRQEMLAAKNNH